MNDDDWQIFVDKAEREMQKQSAANDPQHRKPDVLLNFSLALLSPVCFLFAFIFPDDGTAILFFTVWLGSGLWAVGTLIAYGYSNKVGQQLKNAALSLLLGNLLVFFVFVLKPT